MSDETRQWAEALGHWLLAWSVVVAAVIAWLVVFRPRRAGLRYGAWLLATFAGVGFLPLVGAVGPVVSWQQVRQLLRGDASVPQSQPPAAFQSWFAPESAAASLSADVNSEGERGRASVANARPSLESGAAAWPEGSPAVSRGGVGYPVVPLVLAIWAAGAGLFLARLVRAAVASRRLMAESNAAVLDDLQSDLTAAREALGLRRPVRVAVHPEIQAPMCMGLLRPTILWPAEENCPMTAKQRRASLVHELAHLRRHDDWIALAAELWRAFAWFYLPVHAALGRLRREREYLCDDLAASGFERPESYAQLLLDLAPVRVPVKLLFSSFAGGAAMPSRIRRILRGDLRHALPLSRKQIAVLAALSVVLLLGAGSVRLVGFVARAAAEEAPAAPLPDVTPQELAEKLRGALRDYESAYLEAEFDVEQNTNYSYRGEEKEPIIVKTKGRFWYACDGQRWRGEYDGKVPGRGRRILSPNRWSAGFDGKLHYAWDRDDPDVLVLGEQQAHEGIPLREFFWRSTTPDSLAKDRWKISRQEVVEGYRCYVLEYVDEDYRTEMVVSPRQSCLLLRLKAFSKDKLSWSYELHDLAKTETGVWYPRRVIDKSPSWRTRDARVVRFEAPKKFADDYFTLEMPYNVAIVDYRNGVAYRNDVWWPELAPMLREQFDWPRVDVMPLNELRSDADAPIQGKTAPPIEAAEWIIGEPVDLAQLRGKVTLLYFSSGSLWGPNPEWVAALKELYRVYRPAGLEMVGVVGSTKDVEKVRQELQELQVPYPVAVDTALEGHFYGRTFKAYGLKNYLSPILVDHEGKVHLVEQGKLVEEVVHLLKAAGAENVEPMKIDFARMPDGMVPAIQQAWEDAIRAAPATGKIVGKIADSKGPIPLADVEGRLGFRMLSGNSHAGTYGFGLRDQKLHATTGADGTFEITGLCKGTYDLTISAPGKAIVGRTVVVKPDLAPVSIEVVLEQADGIVGRVLDEEGSAIGGATVSIRHRHFDPEIPQRWMTYRADPAISDAEGRFRFDQLYTGAYTLDITADGYENAALEQIPAGTENAQVRMKRAKQ